MGNYDKNESLTEFAEIIGGFFINLSNFSEKILKKTDNIQGETFSDKIDKFNLAIQLTAIDYINILIENKWWMIPDGDGGLTLSEIAELKKLNNNEIDNFILKIYKDNDYKKLEDIIDNWETNNYFKRKMNILKKSFYAFKKENFSLSIHTLTLQIEGILRIWFWDCFQEDEKSSGNIKSDIKELHFSEQNIGKFIEKIKIQLEKKIDLIIKEKKFNTKREEIFFKEKMLKYFKIDRIYRFFEQPATKPYSYNEKSGGFQDIPPENLQKLSSEIRMNRQIVAHGLYAENDNDEINSLKLILLLDLINELIIDE